jgi:hypothetical protein
LVTFVRSNPNFSVFVGGVGLFLAGLSRYSGPLTLVVGGLILMLVAVSPLVIARAR